MKQPQEQQTLTDIIKYIAGQEIAKLMSAQEKLIQELSNRVTALEQATSCININAPAAAEYIYSFYGKSVTRATVINWANKGLLETTGQGRSLKIVMTSLVAFCNKKYGQQPTTAR